MTPSAIPISSHSGSPVRSTTSQEIERLLVIAAVFLSPMTYLRTDIVFFTLSDLVASAAFVVMIANRRVPLRPFADMTSFWLFSVLLLCSGLIAGSLLSGDPLTGAVGVIQYVFSFVCIPLLLLGRPARETMFLCKVMAFSLVFVMLHGVLYSVFSPDDARFFSRNGRLTGLIERENGVGLLAGVGIVYVMWLYFISQISGIVFLALVAPVAYGLLLSASNSGFIVAVVGIFGISFFPRLRQTYPGFHRDWSSCTGGPIPVRTVFPARGVSGAGLRRIDDRRFQRGGNLRWATASHPGGNLPDRSVDLVRGRSGSAPVDQPVRSAGSQYLSVAVFRRRPRFAARLRLLAAYTGIRRLAVIQQSQHALVRGSDVHDTAHVRGCPQRSDPRLRQVPVRSPLASGGDLSVGLPGSPAPETGAQMTHEKGPYQRSSRPSKNRMQLKHPERIINAISGKISFSLFSDFRDNLGYIDNNFVSLS